MKAAFEVDTSEFNKDFRKITREYIPDDAEKALFKVGWIVIRDANDKEPKTPRDIGDLEGSATVYVKKKLNLVLGFNIAYAAWLHEMPEKTKRGTVINWELTNWTKPGSGPKYLESKLAQYKNDYIRFVADNIKGPR